MWGGGIQGTGMENRRSSSSYPNAYTRWTRVFELERLLFLDLSMVDRRLHDDLRKIYLRFESSAFRSPSEVLFILPQCIHTRIDDAAQERRPWQRLLQ
jgi:hypothetical protein